MRKFISKRAVFEKEHGRIILFKVYYDTKWEWYELRTECWIPKYRFFQPPMWGMFRWAYQYDHATVYGPTLDSLKSDHNNAIKFPVGNPSYLTKCGGSVIC